MSGYRVGQRVRRTGARQGPVGQGTEGTIILIVPHPEYPVDVAWDLFERAGGFPMRDDEIEVISE